MGNAIPLIAGSKEGRYVTTGDTLFSNLEKLHPNVTTPKPDKCSGARQLGIDLRVRDELDAYIVPSRNARLAAPNNFLAGKGPSGRADVVQRQAMYDGAVGARGMFQRQNYGNPTPTYNGNAYTLASSYCDGQLKIYASGSAPRHIAMVKSGPSDNVTASLPKRTL
ncbi:hypothetical protein LTR59_014739 [Friedmanniomyces endolithicus]|nr:hypothetical protein LTR94_017490 [Friedmanniomyces endolithicus]KAK0774876.1 hypothetical protein LTR59_014739 [Friedmanniomyces endolithicus]KAK0778996.1 hypothetical protein LTR38_014608 [Friedmanniomyces endolithicus]KAK0782781.1 hypothetical protein LTR75_014320 [Friedmanniomyces endolithicus]